MLWKKNWRKLSKINDGTKYSDKIHHNSEKIIIDVFTEAKMKIDIEDGINFNTYKSK